MKYASVCSGVEAASLAWIPLGWEAVWFSEIEPFPCAVLKERFPNVPNLGDMTKIEGEKYRGTVDLLVGGTPCQGFSAAGKQGGLNDPRSALCLAYCRLLETMRPRWFVWENVPGVFSTNGGEDFREFLRKIDEIGYSVAWRVLDAQFVRVDGFPRAVPQRRRRVFVVGYSGDWRYPASVLFEPGCLPGDTPPRRVKWEGVAADAKGSIRETGEGVAPDAKGGNNEAGSGVFWNGNDYAETLKANCDCDRMPDKGRMNCVIDTRSKNPNGLVISIASGQAGELGCIGEEFSQTLSRNNGGFSYIVTASFMGGQGKKAGEIRTAQVPELLCVHGSQDPIVQADHANAIGRNNGAENCVCQYGDVAGALTARHDSSPCADRGMSIVYENHAQDSRVKPCGECSPQLNAKAGTGGGNLPLVQECFPTTAVRRLLPVECERLMGFPDNWTRIPWRGKPAEDCPDSPRYKACGNSMCVNVMRWIGMRIEYVERKMNRKAGEE